MQSRKVRVKFLSTLKHAVDRYDRTIEVSEGATVGDLLRILLVAYGDGLSGFLFEGDHETIRNDVLILVNDTDISILDGAETVLYENDEVVFMPISHGG